MHIETRHGILHTICDLIFYEINKNIKNILISTLCLSITACGGGGGGSETIVGPQQIQLTGSVGDGPVTDATITVTDSNGDTIATALSDASATYKIDIPNDSLFPVIITATGGTDIVTGERPDFTMISTVTDKQSLTANELTANVNPFSTFMVKMSRGMRGGISRRNLGAAKQVLMQKFNFGFDSDIINDPIISQITEANVASVVKASEAMGEMIRRTRDTLVSSGNQLNGDDVIDALSSDIADGKIDGLGANANAKLTAIAKIVSAQVLIEVLGNRLKVKGSDATELLDSAINITEPDASMTTADVMITVDLITQTLASVAAATRYNASSELSNIAAILSSLSGNMSPEDVKNALPSDAGDALESAIDSVKTATEEDIDKINKGIDSDNPVPASPVIITVAIKTAQVGMLYHYDVNATDANSDDILSYSLTTAPDSMAINESTGSITWTPSVTQTGTHTVTVRVIDNASPALSTTQNFIVVVAAAPVINVAPVISTEAITTAQVGSSYRYDVNATDTNAGDTLSYSLTSAPTGMAIDSSNGVITWTPASTQTGTQNVTVRVSDSAATALTVTQIFSIQVVPAPVTNVAPVITTTAVTTAQVGVAYKYDVNAKDSNTDDTLTYSLASSPAGMGINASSGFVSWTPSDSQSGTHDVTVVVQDNASSALSSTQNYTVQVISAPVTNVKPAITSIAVTAAQVGTAYRYDVNATDDNSNDVLSYSLTSAPNGMTINAINGVITWTPAGSQTGNHSVTVDVNDNASPSLTSTQSFTIQVIAAPVVNVRPVITSTPIMKGEVNKPYRYDVNATDDNSGDILSYTLITAPNGMTINASDGVITWTPLASQTGTQNVSVRIDDNQSPNMSSLHNFSITVSGVVIRVNAGGGEYIDSMDQVWAADYGYNLGAGNTRNNDISNTVDDELFQSERWHSTWRDTASAELEYSFSVPNGNYAVRLLFAETCSTCTNNIFDIEIEGILVIDDLDLASSPGANIALIRNFNATVNNGEMNIRFPRSRNSPKISAIEILSITNQTNTSTSNSSPVEIQIPEYNNGTGTLSIVGMPEKGTAATIGNNITYTPSANFDGQDIIVYSFTDANGLLTFSTITVTVSCTTCTSEPIITLNWQPNAEAVSGYRIYYGADGASATELISDVAVNSGLIDPTAPQIEYAATSDLNFYRGEQICFIIQAYKDGNSSALSAPVCDTI